MDGFLQIFQKRLFGDDNALDAVVAIVVVNAEEVDTSFNIHVNVVDNAVKSHNADQLASDVVDSQSVQVFTLHSNHIDSWVRIDFNLSHLNTYFDSLSI